MKLANLTVFFLLSGGFCRQFLASQHPFDENVGLRHGLLVQWSFESAFSGTRGKMQFVRLMDAETKYQNMEFP